MLNLRIDPRILGNKYNLREFLAILEMAKGGVESNFLDFETEEEDEDRLAHIEKPLKNWIYDLLGELEESIEDIDLPARPPKPVPRHHQLYTEPAEESADEEIMRRLKQ